MIADGRLSCGCQDVYAIKDMQHDMCALGSKVVAKKIGGRSDSGDECKYKN